MLSGRKTAARKTARAGKRVLRKAKPPFRKPGLKAAHGKRLADSHVMNLFLEVAGEKALHVAGELCTPMTDEDLAEAAKTKISEVRAVMNKLHSAGLATYSRARNEDGWYTYTWSLSLDQAKRLLEERGVVKRGPSPGSECGEYYACPNCFAQSGKRFGFDKASENEFRCPECSEMLKFVEKKG